MQFIQQFLSESRQIIEKIDRQTIADAVTLLKNLRETNGRLFILGIGGSAANAAHAVNDFRKIVGIEAYAPTDNVAELTARTNDDGFKTIFSEWLAVSRLQKNDALLILSVGGGDSEKNVSPNLIAAVDYAKKIGTSILGIIGRDGGYTAKHADVSIIIPTINPLHITPQTEAFQAIIWHLLVSHPALKMHETKWESTKSI